MTDQTPMLRSTLAHALEAVGVRPPSAELFAGTYGVVEWTPYVVKGCFEIIANRLPDTDVNAEVVRRAARMIKQADEIQWDPTETPEQVAAEQPYLDAISRRTAKQDARDERARKRAASRITLELSASQKRALLDPRVPLAAPGRVGTWAKHFAPHLLPQIEPFCWSQFGVGYADVDPSEVVNRMIRYGIVDLVALPPATGWRGAAHAQIQLGPRYLGYMLRWDLKPKRLQHHLWVSLVQQLNLKWGTAFDPKAWT